MVAATRRASWRSSMVQQVPKAFCPEAVVWPWSYNCIDTPMTS